jgi:hypothetical protein
MRSLKFVDWFLTRELKISEFWVAMIVIAIGFLFYGREKPLLWISYHLFGITLLTLGVTHLVALFIQMMGFNEIGKSLRWSLLLLRSGFCGLAIVATIYSGGEELSRTLIFVVYFAHDCWAGSSLAYRGRACRT